MVSPVRSRLAFWSGANYLKRDPSSGSAPMTLGGSFSTTTLPINHNLGYIPFYEVHSEIDNAGIVWNDTKIEATTDTSAGVTPTLPDLETYITTTQLIITLTNSTSPLATGTRMVYWAIYKDYGNV